MRKKLYLFGGAIAILLLMGGCVSKHSGVDHEYLGYVPDLHTVNKERNFYQHKRLTAIPEVQNIGEATLYNASELQKHSPNLTKNIIVTSMVDVDDFAQSSDFGRLYSDSMITNFKRLGWSVIDFRGVNVVTKVKSGEFYLDRSKLKSTPKNSVVFVGTYGHYDTQSNTDKEPYGLLINVRLLDKATNQVLSASNVQLNDERSYRLSMKSNCKNLDCENIKSEFQMRILDDDCKNAARCECENPNDCLSEKAL